MRANRRQRTPSRAARTDELGTLIERNRVQLGLSQAAAGDRCDITGTRWRDLVAGYRDDRPIVQSPAVVNRLAQMCQVVGLKPEEIRTIRSDVAYELLRMQQTRAESELDTVAGLRLSIANVSALLIWLRQAAGEEVFAGALEIALRQGPNRTAATSSQTLDYANRPR